VGTGDAPPPTQNYHSQKSDRNAIASFNITRTYLTQNCDKVTAISANFYKFTDINRGACGWGMWFYFNGLSLTDCEFGYYWCVDRGGGNTTRE